ncbi:MAG: hypothetical protein M3460_29195, partial [Actinomycetota bacterium]|nr:hypothetical protein [Actinomycetota bacterium]
KKTVFQVVYEPATPSPDAGKSFRVVYAPGSSLRKQLAATQSTKDGTPVAYDPTSKPVEDPIITRIRLAHMEREWNTLKNKFGHLPEFWEIVRQETAP